MISSSIVRASAIPGKVARTGRYSARGASMVAIPADFTRPLRPRAAGALSAARLRSNLTVDGGHSIGGVGVGGGGGFPHTVWLDGITASGRIMLLSSCE